MKDNDAKCFSFILYSDLGIFRKPDINQPVKGQTQYLTYDFIPKPVLLGILGAFIGLGGYLKKGDPEFLSTLRGLEVGIQPLKLDRPKNSFFTSDDFSLRRGPTQKTFIEFTNLHGYGSEEEGGTWIVREQLLIRPSYRIYMRKGGVEGKTYRTLCNRIGEEIAEFTPYMGKNEFPLSVISEGHCNTSEIKEEKKIVNSIFFEEAADEVTIGPPPAHEFYSVPENYAYSMENSHYLHKKAVWSNREFILKRKAIQKRDYEFRDTDDGFTIFFF